MSSHLNENEIHICTVWWHQLSCKQWVITGCLISKGMRAGQSQKTAKMKWAASSLCATTWTKGTRNRLKGLAKQKQTVSALNFYEKFLLLISVTCVVHILHKGSIDSLEYQSSNAFQNPYHGLKILRLLKKKKKKVNFLLFSFGFWSLLRRVFFLYVAKIKVYFLLWMNAGGLMDSPGSSFWVFKGNTESH